MEGKLVDKQVFDSGNFQPAVSPPCGLDSGNPCRNDGPPTLVYNNESSSLVTRCFEAPASRGTVNEQAACRSGASLCVAPDIRLSGNGEDVARPTDYGLILPYPPDPPGLRRWRLHPGYAYIISMMSVMGNLPK